MLNFVHIFNDIRIQNNFRFVDICCWNLNSLQQQTHGSRYLFSGTVTEHFAVSRQHVSRYNLSPVPTDVTIRDYETLQSVNPVAYRVHGAFS